MGQTDFSTLPTFFFDEMNIYHGESAIFGDGAIGGTVQLLSCFPNKEFVNQGRDGLAWNLSAETEWGSFGKNFSGIKLLTDKGRVSNRTALFHSQCDNNYSFSFRGENHKQKNAEYHNFGLLNETSVRLGKEHNISGEGNTIGADVWFTKYIRDIQPMMQNNDDPTKYEDISDQSVKIVLRQDRTAWGYDLHSKIAWSNDREKYQDDLIATHDLSVQSGIVKKNNLLNHILNKKENKHDFNWGAGGDFHYIKPEIYAYKEGTNELRGSVYLLSKYSRSWICHEDSCPHKHKPSDDITIHANIRKNFVSDLSIPLSLSFGIGTFFIKGIRFQWQSGCSLAQNSKSPTLNDRYWGDNANKELVPETAFNMEWKNQFYFKGTHKRHTHCLDISLYRNDVDNWIMWMPRGNVWKPTNIDNVIARGIEVGSTHNLRIYKSEQKIALFYNHSFTEIIKGFDNMKPFTGHQMPLLPQNTFSGNWNCKIKHLETEISGRFTGERSSSDIFDILPGYLLFDLSCQYEFNLCKKGKLGNTISLRGKIRNLFDIEYQNLPFRSMPGRNYSIGAKWEIGKGKP